MAFSIGAVVATLKANVTDFKAGMEQAKASLAKFKDSIKAVTDQLNTLALAGGVVLAGIVKGFSSAIKAANQYQAALTGLSTVAKAFGVNQEAANDAAKHLASDGLMTVTEAAEGLKNLLASRFSLDEAIILMNRFKDSAAFGRQGALGFGEAIVGATQGIKNGNSIMVDNAGVTKNLSVILEEAGFSAQDLMKATTDTNVRMALFNGIVKETKANVGDAAKLTGLAAGEQAKFAATTTTAKQAIGEALQPALKAILSILTPLVQVIPKFADRIVAATAAVFAIVGAFVALIAVLKIVLLLSSPIMLLFAVLAALVGITVYKAFERMQTKLRDTSATTEEETSTMAGAFDTNMGKINELSDETIAKLAEIDEQMGKTTRDFLQDLATMVRGHQEKVKEITGQLAGENAAFAEAQEERQKKFDENFSEEAESHGDKTRQLMKDIDAEVAKGKKADLEKITSLRQELATEEARYAERNAKLTKDFQDLTTKETAEHEKRTSALQNRLDEEQAILVKHEEEVAQVKEVYILNDIEKLKQSYTEKMAQYAKDKDEAIKADREKSGSASSASASIVKSMQEAADQTKKQFNSIPGMIDVNAFSGIGGNIGRAFVDSLKEVIVEFFTKTLPKLLVTVMNAVNPANLLEKGIGFGKDIAEKEFSFIKDLIGKIPGFASGVRNFTGGLAMVGESGPELAYLPRGSSVFSNRETQSMLSPQQNGPSVVHNHNYSTTIKAAAFMGTPGEARKFAERITEEQEKTRVIRGGTR